MRRAFVPFLVLCLIGLGDRALAAPNASAAVSYDEALRDAERAAPDLQIARMQEGVAKTEIGIAGIYPNPSIAAGTNTQTARLTGTLSVPLVVFGQRGAAIDAARAEQATVTLDTRVTANDVRQAAAKAFVAVWLAQGIAEARRESAAIQTGLESAVVQRVEVGSAPQIDALRVHAEKLRADAEVTVADADVDAAGTDLGRWIGQVDGAPVRARGEPRAPDPASDLVTLASRVDESALVKRAQSEVAAAEARADRERALVRPTIGVDLGFDAYDATLCSVPGCNPPVNLRGQLSFEVPLFNQRGPLIDREHALAEVARSRVHAAHVEATAALVAAYRIYQAATLARRTLADAVVPAAREAARSTEEAYSLGRAQLVAVLDAERSLVDAQVLALQAQAAQADAWIDVEHAMGTP